MDKYYFIDKKIENQREFFKSNKTKDIFYRIKKLDILKRAIIEYEDRILEALKLDLGKSKFEAYETEIGVVLSEISHAKKNLGKWDKPKKVRVSYANFGSKSYIYNQPYGVCLIIAPWNYPFQLSISPLIGSIIAGNCSVIKTSEFASNTAMVIEKMIEEFFDESYITVIQGDLETSKYILDKDFDYIFFTGSPNVGSLVMQSAAKSLTPVTLELGGKSPCIVDFTANIDLSAKRIVWGKLLNSGQTCVAPDYIIVHESVRDELIECMIRYIKEFYSNNILENDDYTSIINKHHFNRIISLINYEKVVFGGEYNVENLKIEPTIIDDVTLEDYVMKEEIFGPIIPIVVYENKEEISDIVNKNKNPLALYLFTKDKRFEEYIINNISFGGGCINDTIMHITNPEAPFGGIGSSGIGAYHGKRSFDSFSHQKTILKSSDKIDIKLKYPPFSEKGLRLLKKIMR